MNILVINGSPKSKNSNTYQITAAFLDGMNSVRNHSVELIDISQSMIEHCLGAMPVGRKHPDSALSAMTWQDI